MTDFSGNYTVTPIVTHGQWWSADRAGVPISDKPCYRIEGPGQFCAVVWSAVDDPRQVLFDFFCDFMPGQKVATAPVSQSFNVTIKEEN